MKAKRLFALFLVIIMAAAAAAVGIASRADAAATTTPVTECDIVRQQENTPPTGDWVLYTRTPASGGAFVAGPANPPAGTGSLRLQTPTGADKVFLFNYDYLNKPLASIDTIKYSTYRDPASTASAVQIPALNIQVDFNGPASGGFTTLVFEPVYNTSQGTVAPGQWQTWDAVSGRWWSTQPINGMCAGAVISCMRTWSQIVASNPDAVITGGLGVNQGSGNGGLTAFVDALTIGVSGNTTTYDFEPDADADCVADSRDNCPTTANADQANTDGDAEGDACDLDDDNDGVQDGNDLCPGTPSNTQVNGSGCPDLDGDTVADANDNCPSTPNTNQADLDGDNVGDACDPDIDGDGVLNENDNCLTTPNPGQADADGDGQGDVCDADDDNDGVLDGPDNCDFTPNANQLDTDGDGQGNACDLDDDGDGVNDSADNCPLTPNADQKDFDGDGQGDACDPPPASKDQCKNNGWQAWAPRFRNQGDCIQYFNTAK